MLRGYRWTRGLVRGPGRLFWPMTVVGSEQVPEQGPVLVAANHASFLDPWFLAAALPGRIVRYLINEPWYRRSALWTRFFASCGCIPARQGDPVETLARVGEALSGGMAVGIFPEGKISPDGRPGRARAGLGILAARSGAPVVPCAILGSHEILPKGRAVPRPGPVAIRFGAPLYFPGGPTPQPDPRSAARFSGEVMARIRGQFESAESVSPAATRSTSRLV